MAINTLNFSDSSYRELEKKLNLTSKEGFDELIKYLRREAVNRDLRGCVHYTGLKVVANTLSAFDNISFSENLSTCMLIEDWNQLQENSKLNLFKDKFKKWIFHDMNLTLADAIDEDYRYGRVDETLVNLSNLLTSIKITEI